MPALFEKREPRGRRGRLASAAGLWIAAIAACAFVTRLPGAPLWLACGLAATVALWALVATSRAVRMDGPPPARSEWARNLTLLIVSTTLPLAAAEGYLSLRHGRALAALREASARDAALRRAPAEHPAGGPAPSPAAGDSQPEPASPRRRALRRSRLEKALASFDVEVPSAVLRAAELRRRLVTLPAEFERRPAEVEGAVSAQRWHGVLHVRDSDGVRRSEPFPPKRAGVFRIVVLGDSLTYGSGVAEEWTYARQLERLLAREHRVEVLNLGVEGIQSEEVLARARRFLPELEPDLVIYGVCHNDFLPAGVEQYANEAFSIAAPGGLKAFFAERSTLVRRARDGYHDLLVQLGLRVDFYADILRDFRGYQERFARDVSRLNRAVTGRGLPPTVALVLDQFPRVGSRGHRLTRAAESHLLEAGMEVVDTEPYYRVFDRIPLSVSRWEEHPNEIAHAVWARLLGRRLLELGALSPSRDGDRAPGSEARRGG